MFVMPVQHGEAATRIKYYEPDGTEVLDKDDPYLFLRYEAADPANSKRKAESVAVDDPVDDSPKDDDDEEAKVDPARALEAIVSAERELVVMHDLTKNIENLRTVSVQYVDRALTEQEKLLVTASAVERRKKDLRAASARLRAVAQQMRSEVEQDRVFIQSLSDLQAFWRIRSTPGRQETQFHAALVFPISVAPERLVAANQPPPKMPFELTRLQQGLNGAVIVTLAPEHITPTVQDDALGSAQAQAKATVAVGTKEVHQLLLKRFYDLMWKAVHQRCSWELKHASDALFTRKVVAATLSRMEQAFDLRDPLARFRPLLWQHMLSQMIPGKNVTASSVLVPNLFIRLKATHLRSKIHQALAAQIEQYKNAQLMELPHGKQALLCLLLSAPEQGCMTVTCLLDGRITIHAMPRGSSPVHTCLWLTEYRTHSDSLSVLDNLLVRFWGHPPSPA